MERKITNYVDERHRYLTVQIYLNRTMSQTVIIG
jgi:hypothetical protein